MIIEFTVPGVPRGKGRPRFARTGRAYTPAETAAYENLVKLAYLQAAGDAIGPQGAISLHVTAMMPIPASASAKRRAAMLGAPHTKCPDLDNVLKAVLDGLNGAAFNDDSQVATITAQKVYGSPPRLMVVISDRAPTE